MNVGREIERLEREVAEGRETAQICKELARLSLQVNEVRAFTNWCHEAIRIDPQDAEPHLMMARVLIDRRRWFLGASTEWPGVVPADVELGNLDELAGKYPAVAADLRAIAASVRH